MVRYFGPLGFSGSAPRTVTLVGLDLQEILVAQPTPPGVFVLTLRL